MADTPFESVVTEHGRHVLTLCMAMLGSDEAEDAWSETFLAALRAWPDLPDDLDPRAWLTVVARRKCLDLLRARARRAVPTDRQPEVGVPGPEPGDEGVWAHVAVLPTKQRQVVTYRYLGGLSYAQIATLTGGTEAAARRAAADGLKTLRAKEIR
ncbi:sigma-70 family RNA polymerase sigma factor [Marihabitans asiaticum]|uniref:DNA-directed RNA polymerase specialized sigma24 family protein n=1 Tax=Marihabitans asiaticum TaxID=415218 RepID=A0A560WI24_9MICO|nr:sigma-70 family RNA polymerase sigma factor [Marihabitans asiaticum]TWD17164.1 DNA-directed RNA polymerase specialized sigma24 family protein [Marihabitans asiaticum]